MTEGIFLRLEKQVVLESGGINDSRSAVDNF